MKLSGYLNFHKPFVVRLARSRHTVSHSFAATACAITCLLAGCGQVHFNLGSGPQAASISVTPNIASVTQGGSQKFVATVLNTGNDNVVWSVSALPSAGAQTKGSIGAIDSSGTYTAPANLSSPITVQVTATSSAIPRLIASAKVSVSSSPAITVSPANASVEAKATQTFSASLFDPSIGPVQWLVNGAPGGSVSTGIITSSGVYTAPSMSPGATVTIQAVSSTNSAAIGTAIVTITNPPQQALTGISYNKLLSSWNDTQLPWVNSLSGLEWNAASRSWTSIEGWTAPGSGIGSSVYYLYTTLDPITEMALAKQDVPLMEELALFHLALMEQRTTTIGTMIQSAPSGAQIFIDGSPSDRTFVADGFNTATQVRITECQLCDARYLLSAARLLRAVAKLHPNQRTATLTNFVSSFSGFIANEQIIRLLYGSTPWSHWDNPNIPQPLVSGWTFLAATGYEPPHPIKYEAGVTDAELWIMADAAEVLGADASAPELRILDGSTRLKLQQAMAAGTSLLERRSHHETAPDGADTLSTLAGDFEDHPDFAYSAYDGSTTPTTPNPKYGLMADAMHSSILPAVFESLYENRAAAGTSFPALPDIVSLANTYVHRAFNGDTQLPDFNNYIDGWNGWFRVGYPDIPGGYPPHQFCDAQLDPDNCMAAGTLQGWGHLAAYNPDLAALEQNLINLANDKSDATQQFKTQHYWYKGPFTTDAVDYPSLLIYIGGDASQMVN